MHYYAIVSLALYEWTHYIPCTYHIDRLSTRNLPIVESVEKENVKRRHNATENEACCSCVNDFYEGEMICFPQVEIPYIWWRKGELKIPKKGKTPFPQKKPFIWNYSRILKKCKILSSKMAAKNILRHNLLISNTSQLNLILSMKKGLWHQDFCSMIMTFYNARDFCSLVNF